MKPEQTQRPARSPSRGPGAFGLALVLLVLTGIALVFLLKTKAKAVQAEPKTEQASPFADLPPEAPPEKQAKTKGEQQREQQKQGQK